MTDTALIHGFYLTGDKKGRRFTLDDIDDAMQDEALTWAHFDYTNEGAQAWLTQHSQLDEPIIDALLSDETRPRAHIVNDGVLLSLRGVNLSQGADPEDMVSIRLWIDRKRIVSTRRRPLRSTEDLVERIQEGDTPNSIGEFVALLTDRLTERMQETIHDIEDHIDQIQENLVSDTSSETRAQIANLRRKAIALRRYLSPQREAMTQLQNEKINLFNEDERVQIREVADHLLRHIEDLDAVRDRAAVTQEELVNRISEQLNNRMYWLSIVTVLFLPLGFLTGLLGINVGGIPGADNPQAFAIFVGIVAGILIAQLIYFKHKGWF
ncbi:zinc transporter ZntB [bacterium]|nr:zinc transporter ZntB [bacterium]